MTFYSLYSSADLAIDPKRIARFFGHAACNPRRILCRVSEFIGRSASPGSGRLLGLGPLELDAAFLLNARMFDSFHLTF